MKETISFKCSYCSKLYTTKDSCRAHESKCYFNPLTNSCASCTFLKYDSYRYKSAYSMAVRTCMHNKDLTPKLKTNCKQHCPKAELTSSMNIKNAESGYRPIPFVKRYLKKHGLKIEGELFISQREDFDETFLDDEYFSLMADAYINKLVNAVGYNILFYQVAELYSEHDSIKVEDLEKHCNLYIDEINFLLNLFYFIDIKKIPLQKIIEKTANKLKASVLLPHFLIQKGEIEYNFIMAKKEQLYGDEDREYYFKQQAKQMQKVGAMNKLFLQYFKAKLPTDSFDNLSKMYYKWCLKQILEISPNLKEEIIAKVEIKTNTKIYSSLDFDNNEAPF